MLGMADRGHCHISDKVQAWANIMGLEVGKGGMRATGFSTRIKSWQHDKSTKEEDKKMTWRDSGLKIQTNKINKQIMRSALRGKLKSKNS